MHRGTEPGSVEIEVWIQKFEIPELKILEMQRQVHRQLDFQDKKDSSSWTFLGLSQLQKPDPFVQLIQLMQPYCISLCTMDTRGGPLEAIFSFKMHTHPQLRLI